MLIYEKKYGNRKLGRILYASLDVSYVNEMTGGGYLGLGGWLLAICKRQQFYLLLHTQEDSQG